MTHGATLSWIDGVRPMRAVLREDTPVVARGGHANPVQRHARGQQRAGALHDRRRLKLHPPGLPPQSKALAAQFTTHLYQSVLQAHVVQPPRYTVHRMAFGNR